MCHASCLPPPHNLRYSELILFITRQGSARFCPLFGAHTPLASTSPSVPQGAGRRLCGTGERGVRGRRRCPPRAAPAAILCPLPAAARPRALPSRHGGGGAARAAAAAAGRKRVGGRHRPISGALPAGVARQLCRGRRAALLPPPGCPPPLPAPVTAARRRSRRPVPAGAAPAEGRREGGWGGEAKTGAAHVMGRRSQ